MKRCICVLLLLCLLLLSIGCQSEAEPDLIACPIPGAAWGMHRDDFLEKFGLNEQLESEEQAVFVFTPEELGVDVEAFTGLPGSGNKVTGNRVVVQFADHPVNSEESYMCLCNVSLWVLAEDWDALDVALSERFGTPITEHIWGAYPLNETVTGEEKKQYGDVLHVGTYRYTLYPMLQVYADYFRTDGAPGTENGSRVFHLLFHGGWQWKNDRIWCYE